MWLLIVRRVKKKLTVVVGFGRVVKAVHWRAEGCRIEPQQRQFDNFSFQLAVDCKR
jgi:hypothetical protein